MLLERSSFTAQGFIVNLWLTDEDYQSEIKLMVYVNTTIPLRTGDRIAQLLLLPYHKSNAAPINRMRRFGSTGRLGILTKCY